MAASLNPRKRKANFTGNEGEVLVNELERRKELVTGELGRTYKTPNDQRKAWEEVTRCINSISCVERQWREVKDKWLDLKSRCKKKAVSAFKSTQKTGGGPPELQLSALEERVISLCGQAVIYGLPTYIDSSGLIPVCNNTAIQNTDSESLHDPSSRENNSRDPAQMTQPQLTCNNPKKLADKNFEELRCQQNQIILGDYLFPLILSNLTELKKQQIKIESEKLEIEKEKLLMKKNFSNKFHPK